MITAKEMRTGAVKDFVEKLLTELLETAYKNVPEDKEILIAFKSSYRSDGSSLLHVIGDRDAEVMKLDSEFITKDNYSDVVKEIKGIATSLGYTVSINSYGWHTDGWFNIFLNW